MSSFEWDACFVTGEALIDAQHRALVRRINALAELLIQRDTVSAETLTEAVDALSAYATRHFADEEGLATQAGVDPRTMRDHHTLHVAFTAEVERMRPEVGGGGAAARKVLVFLVQWLAHHILGADQALVREVQAVRSGVTPAAARDAEARAAVVTSDPLIHALSELFGVLSMRNAELAEANRRLEARIAERTAELAAANERLEKLACTDVLTGLANRRGALATLERLWEEGTPLTVVMVDADNFKWVNDTFGHEAGDAVLRTLARTLGGALRTDDVVARLGGDEFLLVLPHTGTACGTDVARGVLRAVLALEVSLQQGVWTGSASFGVASRRADMGGVLDLLRAADGALYEAKRGGRARVGVARSMRLTA